MRALLAALPIALVLVAMIGWRWRAAGAGLLGLAAALAVAVGVFGFGTQVYGELGLARAASGALAEALFTTATILWIVFPALCIYELQAETGAFDLLRRGLARLSDDPGVLVLLVGFFAALFVEGVAGFGTPIALTAPVLVRLGYAPARAVSLALVGHAAGVSFGAVGTPVMPQVAATGLPALELSRWTALLHAAVGWVLVVFLLRLARPDDAGAAAPARRWADGALAVLSFFVPFLALATLVGPELPTLGGAVIGMCVFAAIVRRRARTGPAAADDGPDLDARTLLRAGLPYVVLLALVLVTRLVPPLRAPLQGYAWEWSLLAVFDGRVAPLYHPGTLLLLGFLVGGLAQGHGAGRLAAAAARAGRRMAPVVLALVAMLGLSRVAVHAGMIQALAESAAGAGRAWPVLAPFVGVLGTFVTGSATSSNILFSDFQQATAAALGLPIAALQGAQGFGAAVGNIVCPHNVIAGGATVGLGRGGEGEVLRATVLPCVAYAAAGGLVLLALLQR